MPLLNHLLNPIAHILLQSDGVGGFFSALFTVTPLSIFAQVILYSPQS